MLADELALLPATPASEVEWEDLLIRLEIVPRVLRNLLDDADPADRRLAEIVHELVSTESRVGGWLAAVAAGSSPDPEHVAASPEVRDVEWLAHRFASLRARTFTMVQRRGVEVWAWEGEIGPEQHASVYQFLAWLAGHDGNALAALRDAIRNRALAC